MTIIEALVMILIDIIAPIFIMIGLGYLVQLKFKLDEFSSTFVDVYTQIVNESDKIMNITTTSENQ